jgi:hypothetical protein
VIIPNGLLKQFLISRQENREQPLGFMSVPYVKNIQKSSEVTTLGASSKLNTLLAVHSWEPDQKEIRNRRHSASVAFAVNVAEAALAKNADL